MKSQVIILILILFLFNCEKESTRYFDAKNLNQLNLLEVEQFWTDDEQIDTSYSKAIFLGTSEGYIGQRNTFAK